MFEKCVKFDFHKFFEDQDNIQEPLISSCALSINFCQFILTLILHTFKDKPSHKKVLDSIRKFLKYRNVTDSCNTHTRIARNLVSSFCMINKRRRIIKTDCRLSHFALITLPKIRLAIPLKCLFSSLS